MFLSLLYYWSTLVEAEAVLLIFPENSRASSEITLCALIWLYTMSKRLPELLLFRKLDPGGGEVPLL